ncbi:hypothetical protein CEXT_523301 [Caerostris extrusa]|uniref:histone acetyltransferase n=1 Tax=Caerostris extrusa TaxID=172846 RepID=A0AAV4XWQ7_CAEEX|nr:hypothetical protein CEXT_523301 [Caerostris extrusa]
MQNSNLEVTESTVEQNAAPCSESAVNNATTVAITNSAPSPTVDQEKLRLIQKQLVLLLHAYACRRKDCQSGWASTLCSLPNCATMKHVPSHMKVCKIGKQWTLPHCAYSSQNISHWRNCTANDCPVCVPLQEAAARTQQAATVQVAQSNQELGLVDTQRACAEPVFQLGTSNDGIGMNNIAHADPLMSDQVVHSCSLQNLNHIRAFPPGQQNIPQSPLQMEYVLQNNAVSIKNSETRAVNTATDGAIANSAPAPTADQRKHKLMQLQLLRFLQAKQTAFRRDPDLTIQTKCKLLLEDIQRAYAGLGLKLGTANDGIDLNTVEQVDPLMSNQVVQSCSLQNLNHIQAFQPGQQNTPQSPLQMESMLQNNAVSFPNSKTSNVINENFPSKLAAPSADLLSSPNQKNRIPNLITDNSVPVKDWPLNMDRRHYVVQQMIQSMCPAVNSNMLKDHRLASLVSLVEKVERDTYKNANSKQEYCRLLAEILVKMQKILKDKENRLSKQRGN